MNDFFKKLNVLVNASLREALNEPRQGLTHDRLGKNIEQEVVLLRDRVNEALDYEDKLANRVRELQSEAEHLDQTADEALAKGQDDDARRKVTDLKRAQQRLAMAESDLREHRIVTQELITRVNELDAAVADARRARGEEAPTEEPLERAGRAVADVLHEMREKITEMSEMINMSTTPDDEPGEIDEHQSEIDDDLESRRSRLSKK
jgi:phage shock protein A